MSDDTERQWWGELCAQVLARSGSQGDQAPRFQRDLNALKSAGLGLSKHIFGESTVVRAVFFIRTVCFGLVNACSTLLQILVLIYILHVLVCLLEWNCIFFFFFCKCFESSYKGQQTKTRSDPKKRLIGLFTQNPGSFMLSYAKLPQQEWSLTTGFVSVLI